jgi:ribosome-associated protein
MDAKALASACARMADEKKAEDIVVLNVAPLTTLADYFVIATCRNPRQIRALAEQVRQSARQFQAQLLGVEGTAESGWVLVDMGDVIVHIFDAPTRSLYALEMLWGDAPVEDWNTAS